MGNSDSKPKMEDNTDTDEEYLSMMSILGKKSTTTKDVPGTSRPSKKLKSNNRQEDNIAMATPSSSKSFQKATIPIPTLIDLSSDEFDSIHDPSVSWETQTYVPNNVTEYVKQLQEMFPETPVKYFEEEAKKIIGNFEAMENFISEHLGRGGVPPANWKAMSHVSNTPIHEGINELVQSNETEESVQDCVKRLHEMFPDTPIEYLEFESKQLAGNSAAKEKFIMEHLGRFGAPPVDWQHKNQNPTVTVEDLKVKPNEMSTEQVEKLVLLGTLFPNKDRNVLQSKVKEFDGDGQRMELWIQEQLDGDGDQMRHAVVDDVTNIFVPNTAKLNLNNLDPSEEMKMAGLDFVKCPVCSSAAINEFNTLIICQNSACAKESCNLCKKESHLPWPCEQIFDLNNTPAEAAAQNMKWWKKTVLPSRSVEPENQEDTDFRLVESQFLRMCRQHNVRPPNMRRQPPPPPPTKRRKTRGTNTTATAAGMVQGLPPPGAYQNYYGGAYNMYYVGGLPAGGGYVVPAGGGYVGGLPGGMPASMRPATGVPQAERTITISKIDFIINPDLQMKFEAKKEEFKHRNIPHQTIFTFHGTQIQNIDGICENNLNTINRAAHGHGYYFSEFPDVALGYGQGLLMFKALPGNEYIGGQPNLHYGPNARFQSKKVPSHLVDENKKDCGDMVIIADNQQFMPYCVIHLA